MFVSTTERLNDFVKSLELTTPDAILLIGVLTVGLMTLKYLLEEFFKQFWKLFAILFRGDPVLAEIAQLHDRFDKNLDDAILSHVRSKFSPETGDYSNNIPITAARIDQRLSELVDGSFDNSYFSEVVDSTLSLQLIARYTKQIEDQGSPLYKKLDLVLEQLIEKGCEKLDPPISGKVSDMLAKQISKRLESQIETNIDLLELLDSELPDFLSRALDEMLDSEDLDEDFMEDLEHIIIANGSSRLKSQLKIKGSPIRRSFDDCIAGYLENSFDAGAFDQVLEGPFSRTIMARATDELSDPDSTMSQGLLDKLNTWVDASFEISNSSVEQGLLDEMEAGLPDRLKSLIEDDESELSLELDASISKWASNSFDEILGGSELSESFFSILALDGRSSELQATLYNFVEVGIDGELSEEDSDDEGYDFRDTVLTHERPRKA